MEIPNDPQSIAILELEAQVKALRLLLGVVFLDSPALAKSLAICEAQADDHTLAAPMTERQREVYQAEIRGFRENVERSMRALMEKWLEDHQQPE